MSDTTLYVNQGSNFLSHFVIKLDDETPSDLTGYTFKGHVRRTASTDLVTQFQFIIRDQVTATGQVDMNLPASSFTDAKLKNGTSFVYDVEMTYPDGKKQRIIQGNIEVSPEVTK